MRHLGIPLLVASSLLLLLMVATFLGQLNGGAGIVGLLAWNNGGEAVLAATPTGPATCEPSRGQAYAERLRYEAFTYLGKREYENALSRLNQARSYDPAGDVEVPELREARLELLRHLGAATSPTGAAPGADPNATPSPKATP